MFSMMCECGAQLRLQPVPVHDLRPESYTRGELRCEACEHEAFPLDLEVALAQQLTTQVGLFL